MVGDKALCDFVGALTLGDPLHLSEFRFCFPLNFSIGFAICKNTFVYNHPFPYELILRHCQEENNIYVVNNHSLLMQVSCGM